MKIMIQNSSTHVHLRYRPAQRNKRSSICSCNITPVAAIVVGKKVFIVCVSDRHMVELELECFH